MVSGNYGHGRVRVGVQPDSEPPALAENADAAALAVGDEVVPNYVDTAAREKHASGVILSLEEGTAQVRWAPGDRTESYAVAHLIKR